MTQINSANYEEIATRSEAKSELVEIGSDDARAAAHEERVQKELVTQFQKLKDESRAIFGRVHGRRGVHRAEDWAKMLEKAGDKIGNGKFLVGNLGAERYLDPETVAVLITLRQNLMAELDKPSTAKVMQIDAAIVAYYNLFRVQGWIGNLALAVEGQLFGQEPLSEIHGPRVGDMLEEQLRRLAEIMLPLQDRAHRMMVRSLSAIG